MHKLQVGKTKTFLKDCFSKLIGQVMIKLACSTESGFWALIMLICWVDKTEWGNIPPWIEDSSFRSSSSWNSKTEDERLRLADFRPAIFFSPLEISSFTIFFPTSNMKEKKKVTNNFHYSITSQQKMPKLRPEQEYKISSLMTIKAS